MEAIELALKGFSTKGKERGFGVHTSRKMLEKGLKGTFMLISGNAMLKGDELIEMPYSWEGTILALRIPKNAVKFNFYNFVE